MTILFVGYLQIYQIRKIGCENKVLMQYNVALVSLNSGALAHVSWSENLPFKHPAYFGGKLHSHPDFKRDKNSNKAESFFQLNVNVCVNVEHRERARARNKPIIIIIKNNKNNNEDQFRWKKNMKIL